jgi:hypothetical protein
LAEPELVGDCIEVLIDIDDDMDDGGIEMSEVAEDLELDGRDDDADDVDELMELDGGDDTGALLEAVADDDIDIPEVPGVAMGEGEVGGMDDDIELLMVVIELVDGDEEPEGMEELLEPDDNRLMELDEETKDIEEPLELDSIMLVELGEEAEDTDGLLELNDAILEELGEEACVTEAADPLLTVEPALVMLDKDDCDVDETTLLLDGVWLVKLVEPVELDGDVMELELLTLMPDGEETETNELVEEAEEVVDDDIAGPMT